MGDRTLKLFSADEAPRAFHVMAKPTGAVCNLDCEYCYFVSKEQLYPGGSLGMPLEVHEAYIRQLLEAHQGNDEVIVAFQGGEPTMAGLDFFRRTIELEREFARPGQKILNTLQTNGTLLDDTWGEFLAEHRFLVGISIDGPRELHDTYRVDKGGKPTFDRVMRGLDVLRRHRIDWNVLTTINAANQDHGRRVYTFLRDQCEAQFIQFIPIVERSTAEMLPLAESRRLTRPEERPLYRQEGIHHTTRTVGAEQYGQFLVDVFEEWVRHDVGRVFVQSFDTALGHWLGEDGGVCVHAKTCGIQTALENNGDLYACDHFVEPDYLLGNITEKGQTLLDLVASPRQRHFGQDKFSTLTQYCRDCDFRFACNGGCPKDRFITAPNGEPGHNYLCAGYQRFFKHIDKYMKAMATLLGASRPASGVMELVATEDSRRINSIDLPGTHT